MKPSHIPILISSTFLALGAAAVEPAPALDVNAMKASVEDHYSSKFWRDSIYTSAALSGILIGGSRIAFPDALNGGGRLSPEFGQGVGYGFIGGAVVSGSIGIAQLVAASGQQEFLSEQLDSDPEAFKREELADMEFADNGYWALLGFDTAMVVGGLSTLLVGASQEQDFAAGVGAAVAFHGGIMLGIDIWRAVRASGYRDDVEGFGGAAESE